MEDLLLVAIGAFLAAALTVQAGFGLSTMLTPMVLLLMGPHEAVAVVAIVHGAHNAGKFAALKEHVDFSAFRKYGGWLIVGAILGALLQNQVPQAPLLPKKFFAFFPKYAVANKPVPAVEAATTDPADTALTNSSLSPLY